MAERDPIWQEIKSLAESLSSASEDVQAAAGQLVAEYRHNVQTAYGLDGADKMLQKDILGVEDRLQDRLRRASEGLRDGLKEVLERIRTAGTAPPR